MASTGGISHPTISHELSSAPEELLTKHGVSETINLVVPNGVNGNLNSKSDNWVPIPERCLYQKRKIRVITIGAGFSGLMVAHKVTLLPGCILYRTLADGSRSSMNTSSSVS